MIVTTIRSSQEIKDVIAQRTDLRDKKSAEAEELQAKLPSPVDEGALLIEAHGGDEEAKSKLAEIDRTRRELEDTAKILSAIDIQVPELERGLKQAELKEAMDEEKGLAKKNEPIEHKIREHLAEAARLLDEEWIPVEKQRYSLRIRWGGARRTPKQMAFDWVRGHFGALLHPHLDMPPKTFRKAYGVSKTISTVLPLVPLLLWILPLSRR